MERIHCARGVGTAYHMLWYLFWSSGLESVSALALRAVRRHLLYVPEFAVLPPLFVARRTCCTYLKHRVVLY